VALVAARGRAAGGARRRARGAELAGVTAEALDEAADEARAAGLVVDGGAGRLRFSHAMVAETLAAELPATVRARLHRRAADTLERRHAGDPAAPLEAIAHHLLEGGSEVAARAVTAAAAAAERAANRLAFADAATLYGRALDALALAAPADAARRAVLLVAQGEAHVRCGDATRGAEACRDAAELAIVLDDGELHARAARALGAEGAVGAPAPRMAALLEEALGRLPSGRRSTRRRRRWPCASAIDPARCARGSGSPSTASTCSTSPGSSAPSRPTSGSPARCSSRATSGRRSCSAPCEPPEKAASPTPSSSPRGRGRCASASTTTRCRSGSACGP
jgi:hypothetical protein